MPSRSPTNQPTPRSVRDRSLVRLPRDNLSFHKQLLLRNLLFAKWNSPAETYFDVPIQKEPEQRLICCEKKCSRGVNKFVVIIQAERPWEMGHGKWNALIEQVKQTKGTLHISRDDVKISLDERIVNRLVACDQFVQRSYRLFESTNKLCEKALLAQFRNPMFEDF